jgi:hypothetical protein
MNELLDAVHEAINRAIVETPKGQRSEVTSYAQRAKTADTVGQFWAWGKTSGRRLGELQARLVLRFRLDGNVSL